MSLMFSKHAVDALNAASSCARQFGHDHIGAEHILLSILAIPQCQAAQRLVALGLAETGYVDWAKWSCKFQLLNLLLTSLLLLLGKAIGV